MKLDILACKNRHGLGAGNVWQWYHERILKDYDYTVHDAAAPGPLTGDRLLLMGQMPLNVYLGNQSLHNARGTLYSYINHPTICTYDLQEAYDFKPDKLAHKPTDFGKDTANTQKKNWLFWIEMDTRKLMGELGAPSQCDYIPYPNIVDITARLTKLANATIYLDIETDMQSDTLDCIGFAVNNSPVYVVPIYTYDHNLAYPRANILRFLATLSSALLRNRVVIHNAMFDLLYLACKYRLPFGSNIYDTMVTHQRIYPEVEKSLAHCISRWCWQPYHKDEAALARNAKNQDLYWQYNAKDVWSMRLVEQGQLAYIAQHPHFADSIKQANASIYPYLLASLKGVRIDLELLSQTKLRFDARIAQIVRIIHALTGQPKFNPDSSAQVIKYFHTTLAYKPVDYTATGGPSLGGKALYELALAYDNPLITVILHYREIKKERTMMDFCNWVFPWNEI